MDGEKRELNPSSLLDLKAELLKKQEELKKDKGKTTLKSSERAKIFRKTSVWNKKNAGVLERAQRDLEVKQEEDDVLGRSRKQLEAKTRLYEAMTRVSHPGDIPTEDGSHGFLVDFEQKAVRSLSEVRRQAQKDNGVDQTKVVSSENKSLSGNIVDSADLQEGEEWVDYVDQFGRSRRCMKKDLPPEVAKKSQDQGGVTTNEPQRQLMSADMQRELVRQKWEEHERLTATNPDDPIHYANVQYNEIRTHGTGFYQFVKGEEEREKQLEALRELRDQTKEMRAKKEKLQVRKKSLMKERLLKVKKRKLLREGKNPDELVEEESSSEDDDGLIGPSAKDKAPEQPKEPELLTRDEQLRKDAPTREWDVGKKEEKWFSEARWLEERREERVPDFAPPQVYNDDSRSHVTKKSGIYTAQRTGGFGQQKGRGFGDCTAETVTQADSQSDDMNIQGSFMTRDSTGMNMSKEKPGNKNAMADLEEGLLGENIATREVGVVDIEKELVSKTVKDPMAALEARLLGDNTQEVGVGQTDSDQIARGLREMRAEVDNENRVGRKEVMSYTSREGTLDVSEELQSTTDVGRIPLPTNSQRAMCIPANTTKWQTENSQTRGTGNGEEPATTSMYNQYYENYGMGTYAEYPSGYQSTASHYPSSSGVYTQAPVSFPHTQATSQAQYVGYNNPNAVVVSDANSCIKSSSQDITAPISDVEQVTSNNETSSKTAKAPQPAHFASGPTKSDPKRQPVKYERVNLYDIPDELPAPIGANNMPEYPSMQEILGSRSDTNKAPPNEEKQIKDWYQQFQTGSRSHVKATKSGIARVKPANLPFVSPYVQSKGEKTEGKEAVTFDPSKPPPCVGKYDKNNAR